MAIQSEVFSTAFNVRTFASTKYIATKQHMAIWLKRVSDETWTQLSVNEFELINNSAVLIDAPSSSVYSMIEIRVADEPNELGSSQSDIAILASLESQIQEIVDTVIPNINEILLADDNATIATTKALEASTSAGEALASKNLAVTSAGNALVSEQNADTSEAQALSYKNSATSSANTATTQAGIATAQAVIATTKASEASTSASNALASEQQAGVYAGMIAISVDTIENMTAISLPQEGQVVVVRDANRGGVFIYRSTGVANGGTIFDSSSIGKWYRKYDGAINVKWFGAVGDGINDDLSSIQKCNDYVASSGTEFGFKNIDFPDGIYVMSGTLNWGSTIVANSKGSVILRWSLSSGIGINISTEFANWDTMPKQIAYNMNDSFNGTFVFENTLGKASNTAIGLFLGDNGVDGYSCESLTFTGLKLRGWNKSHTFGSHAYILTFRNCRFDDNKYAIYNSKSNGIDTYTDSWERIYYDDCTFAGNTFVISGDSGAQGDFTINNCSLDYNTTMINSFSNVMIITICGGSHLEWNSTVTAMYINGVVKIIDSYVLWLNGVDAPAPVLLAGVGSNGILVLENNVYTVPSATSIVSLSASSASVYAEEEPIFYGGSVPNYIDNSGGGTIYRRTEVVAGSGRVITNAQGDKTQFFTIPSTALLANENKAITVTFPEAFSEYVGYSNITCQPNGSADFYGVTQHIITGTPLATTTFNIRNGVLAQNAINIIGIAIGR